MQFILNTLAKGAVISILKKKEEKTVLKEAKRFLKTDLYRHIPDERCEDHCTGYSLTIS